MSGAMAGALVAGVVWYVSAVLGLIVDAEPELRGYMSDGLSGVPVSAVLRGGFWLGVLVAAWTIFIGLFGLSKSRELVRGSLAGVGLGVCLVVFWVPFGWVVGYSMIGGMFALVGGGKQDPSRWKRVVKGVIAAVGAFGGAALMEAVLSIISPARSVSEAIDTGLWVGGLLIMYMGVCWVRDWRRRRGERGGGESVRSGEPGGSGE